MNIVAAEDIQHTVFDFLKYRCIAELITFIIYFAI